MKRGDIYWVDLIPRSGSEQAGRRPAIIISHDIFNQAPKWRSIIVIPISTSAAQARRGPTAVLLAKGVGGLKSDSVALCHQVTTLDRTKIKQLLGSITPVLLAQVEQGLKAAMALN